MSTSKELREELREELAGYASPGEFDDRYVDDGVDKDMSNIIVVDNLPVVNEAKRQKLLDFVTKIYSAVGRLAPEGITMPLNASTGMTEGFAFIEFVERADAEKALASTDAWDFDKSHKLRVNRYTDFVAYVQEPDVFVPPAVPVHSGRDDALYWLLDDACRDEFVIRWASAAGAQDVQQTEVLWADARSAPSLDYGGGRQRALGRVWTERAVRWSPRGTYLATFHPQGIVLWCGKGFQEAKRFAHSNVTEALFSPDERYVATWNGHYGNSTPDRALILWDMRLQTEVRAFKQARHDDDEPDFRWSADGRYLARTGVDPASGSELVQIYELPGGGLLDQRSTKAPGARGLSWAPKRSNLIAWWAPELNNAPMSVTVMRVPGREIVRQQNLFNVDGVELVWHPDGVALAVIACKANKARVKKGAKASEPAKRGTHGFTVEIFRLRDKSVPVDVLEIAPRVITVAFEPGVNATRFAIVAESPTAAGRYSISFYSFGEKGITPLFVLEDKIYNALHWSPRGDFIVFSGTVQSMNHGSIEFFDVEHRKSLATAEHAQLSSVEWDPSGRIVATVKTQPQNREPTTRETVQNGYMLWTFQGTRITEAEKHKLFSLAWRPRPEGLLTDEEVKAVARDLKKHISRYTAEDKRAEERKRLLDRLRKRRELDEFHAQLAARRAAWLAAREQRVAIGAEDEPLDVTVTEQIVEVELGETIEIVP